ncbi:MAG: hypothetical protein GC156_01285 [Actinomycetales bacterium]|nr:hypothetical protein [Actinomycetales bacterium]
MLRSRADGHALAGDDLAEQCALHGRAAAVDVGQPSTRGSDRPVSVAEVPARTRLDEGQLGCLGCGQFLMREVFGEGEGLCGAPGLAEGAGSGEERRLARRWRTGETGELQQPCPVRWRLGRLSSRARSAGDSVASAASWASAAARSPSPAAA